MTELAINYRKRNNYGEIVARDLRKAGLKLAEKAQAAGKISPEFETLKWNSRGRKIGKARYHEVYDVNPSNTQAIICVREIEGTKYG